MDFKKKKIIIIGGGASGFFAAANLDEDKYDVSILEQNSDVLQKVKISGVRPMHQGAHSVRRRCQRKGRAASARPVACRSRIWGDQRGAAAAPASAVPWSWAKGNRLATGWVSGRT